MIIKTLPLRDLKSKDGSPDSLVWNQAPLISKIGWYISEHLSDEEVFKLDFLIRDRLKNIRELKTNPPKSVSVEDVALCGEIFNFRIKKCPAQVYLNILDDIGERKKADALTIMKENGIFGAFSLRDLYDKVFIKQSDGSTTFTAVGLRLVDTLQTMKKEEFTPALGIEEEITNLFGYTRNTPTRIYLEIIILLLNKKNTSAYILMEEYKLSTTFSLTDVESALFKEDLSGVRKYSLLGAEVLTHLKEKLKEEEDSLPF